MKLQLLIYLLCFIAVASVSLRAEPNGPLFGGTANGIVEVAITNPSMPDLAKSSSKNTPFCKKPDCQNLPNAAIQTSAKAVKP